MGLTSTVVFQHLPCLMQEHVPDLCAALAEFVHLGQTNARVFQQDV